MKFFRGAVASVGALALVVAGSVAWAAPGDPFGVDSDEFALDAAQCSGTGWNVPFLTRVVGQSTVDEDVDVNAGSSVSTSLMVRGTVSVTYTDAVVNFMTGGVSQEVGPLAFTTQAGWSLVADAPADYVVTAADAGSVIEFATTRYRDPYDGGSDRAPADGDGFVGLYVNKAPALVEDAASTAHATSVVVDVLANDDATWDSGVITSNYPTAAELAVQDDLTEVPVAERGTAVAIATGPADGTATVESDGRVTYAPDAGFSGTDTFTYSVTDNDGATSTAEVTVEVAGPVVATLDVSASATTVGEGGSVTLMAIGFAADGFEIGDVTDEVEFTSDVATDEIDGNMVTFPTASPHTITATHTPTGTTADIVIEVTPAAVATPPVTDASSPIATTTGALPQTGGPSSGWLAGGVLALLAGIGLLAHRARMA